MKWSFKLGKFAGIDVFVHMTFFLLVGWYALMHWQNSRSVSAALFGVLFISAVFLCVVLHEYGHALMARRYGIPTRDIILLPIGGVARLEKMPDRPIQELWVALAGPAVNVAIAAALYVWLQLTASWQPLQSLTVTGAGPASTEGGTAILQEGSILYTPPAGFSGADRFPVTIIDALGAEVEGTVTVTVGPAPGEGGGSETNPPQFTIRPDGGMDIGFQGIPGRAYRLERSIDMTIWITLDTVAASPTGQVTFTDENPPPGRAFYRIAY